MSNIQNEINGFENNTRTPSWGELYCQKGTHLLGGGKLFTAFGDRNIRTATIVDLKWPCPACDRIMGQKEYERVVANLARVVEEKSNGVIEHKKFREVELCEYQEWLIQEQSTQIKELQNQLADYEEELYQKEYKNPTTTNTNHAGGSYNDN